MLEPGVLERIDLYFVDQVELLQSELELLIIGKSYIRQSDQTDMHFLEFEEVRCFLEDAFEFVAFQSG